MQGTFTIIELFAGNVEDSMVGGVVARTVTSVSWLQELNTFSFIEISPVPISIVCNFEQSENAEGLMVSKELGKVMVCNVLHALNADWSIVVRVLDIITFTSSLHPSKALSPIMLTPLGIVIDCKA